jgi:hypothetical protein
VLISEGADKEKATSSGYTSLLIACQEGHVEVVQLLISEGADKEKATSNGATPLSLDRMPGGPYGGGAAASYQRGRRREYTGPQTVHGAAPCRSQ